MARRRQIPECLISEQAALVHGLALDVELQLEEASWGGAPFELLVTYGEELRRALALEPDCDEFAADVLGRYDAELHELRAEIPRTFDLALRVAVDGLHVSARCEEDVLRRLDSILAEVAVACRVGVRPPELAWTTGTEVLAYVTRHAAQLKPIWAKALQRAGQFGADPDYPALYAYLDVLAIHADGAEES